MVLDRCRLVGGVLAAECPRRLSCTLGDNPGEPSVYVTREPRPLDEATTVRLIIDAPWPPADGTDDLEASWLPVLSGLVTQLGVDPGTAGLR
jgi:hypothetical protein